MERRKFASSSGRPSGTDGSDFSRRMVVDSRYTKVAKGKSRLFALIIAQAIVQLIGGLCTFLSSTSKEEGPDMLVISTFALGFISLIIGEFGRRRSRENFLSVHDGIIYYVSFLNCFCCSEKFINRVEERLLPRDAKPSGKSTKSAVPLPSFTSDL